MKKLFIICLLSLLILTGCSNSDSSVKKVAILQLLTHDALDLSKAGFIAALGDNGYIQGQNLEIDYQNPEADNAILPQMAESIMFNNPDLALAIATTPAQQLLNLNMNNIPLLATAVTDFKEAGLADSNENPNRGMAGVSDACPMDRQLDLLLKIIPDAKTVGIIYTSSEPNSEIQAKQMQVECNLKGINTIIKTVSDKTMINDTMLSLVGKIDALYVPTDNNVASAMGSIDVIATENKIPVICAESNSLAKGGLASLGVDYYKIGYQTGEMAAQILNGEKTIDDFKISMQEDIGIYYNSNTANKLGITLPEEVLNGTDVIK